MSTTDAMIPSEMQRSPERPKPSRFAGERLGTWLFAASFSIGIWGLALKILSPAHPTLIATPTPTSHYALLAPSDAADGRATVVWEEGAIDASTGYPVIGGVPVIALSPPDGSDPRRH
jgi:hypothetical protein